MITLMYVSISTLDAGASASAIADIVNRSSVRNGTLSVTGALIFTGKHFAQALEGSGPSIDELMWSISRDPRHRAVMIVDRRPISHLRFPSWHMAYQGAANYVDNPIERLIEKPQSEASPLVERIYQIMTEFARD